MRKKEAIIWHSYILHIALLIENVVDLFIYLFLENFNLCRPFLMIAHYHQTKTPISFWCRRGLNPKSLIQPSETLLIKLTGTHIHYSNLLTLTKKKSQTIAKYILVFSIFFFPEINGIYFIHIY